MGPLPNIPVSEFLRSKNPRYITEREVLEVKGGVGDIRGHQDELGIRFAE